MRDRHTYVDEKLEPLINALSLFPKLQTYESCQGSKESGSFVCFYYGEFWKNNWKEMAKFALCYLGPKLAQELGNLARVYVEAKSFQGIHGVLEVDFGEIKTIADVLKKLAKNYPD